MKKRRKIHLFTILRICFPTGKRPRKRSKITEECGQERDSIRWSGYQDLEGKLAEKAPSDLSGACVLLECVSNLTANEMYMDGGAGENTVKAVVNGICLLKRKCRHLVVVTNEVFSESVPDFPEMTVYKKKPRADQPGSG